MKRTLAATLLAASALVSPALAQGYQSTIPMPNKAAADEAFRRAEQAKEDARRQAAEREQRRQQQREEKAAADAEASRLAKESWDRQQRDAQAQKEADDKAFLERCPIGSPCWMSSNRPQSEIDEWTQRNPQDLKEKQAEEERQQARPVNKVVNAYAAYIIVRICHESREGYLVQYISDAEMDRAEKAIRTAVDKWTAADPTIDKSLAWDDARKYARGLNIAASVEFCQSQLAKLYSLSGSSPYKFGRPE